MAKQGWVWAKGEQDHLARTLGYSPQDWELYAQALTHGSAKQVFGQTYERLEFLGDRVLALVISEVLYKRHPREPEGALAKRLAALVRMQACAQVSQDLSLQPLIRTAAATQGGMGEGAHSANVQADVLEALLGALYLDAGLSQARDFILRSWRSQLESQARPPRDAKTALQEWAQGRGLSLPSYRLLSQEGPDHRPSFRIQVQLSNDLTATGEGESKRAAEQAAAAEILRQQGQKP